MERKGSRKNKTLGIFNLNLHPSMEGGANGSYEPNDVKNSIIVIIIAVSIPMFIHLIYLMLPLKHTRIYTLTHKLKTTLKLAYRGHVPMKNSTANPCLVFKFKTCSKLIFSHQAGHRLGHCTEKF